MTQMFSPGETASRPAARARIFSVIVIPIAKPLSYGKFQVLLSVLDRPSIVYLIEPEKTRSNLPEKHASGERPEYAFAALVSAVGSPRLRERVLREGHHRDGLPDPFANNDGACAAATVDVPDALAQPLPMTTPSADDHLDTFRRKLDREEINQLPIVRYTGATHVVNEATQLPAALSKLRRCPLLGFDTETRPAFRKGERYLPSLLQLATPDDVYVFQLQRVGPPKDLWALLADPDVVKAGVAVRDDIRELQRLREFEPGGFVDLGDIARQARLQTHGLRNMSANLLGFRIAKGAQRSNWAAHDLTARQTTYAATDAWVSRELFVRVVSLGLAPQHPDSGSPDTLPHNAAPHS